MRNNSISVCINREGKSLIELRPTLIHKQSEKRRRLTLSTTLQTQKSELSRNFKANNKNYMIHKDKNNNNNSMNTNISFLLHSACSVSDISGYNNANNTNKKKINEHSYIKKHTTSKRKKNKHIHMNNTISKFGNLYNHEDFQCIDDLNNEYTNIDLINRITKCEKLKSEILINEQLKHYSLEKKFEPVTFYPQKSFVRDKHKYTNRYKPCLKYNKMNIFTKRSSAKYLFRNSSHEKLKSSHYSITTAPRNRSMIIDNTNANNISQKAIKLIEKVESLHKTVYHSNNKLKNEIIKQSMDEENKHNKSFDKKKSNIRLFSQQNGNCKVIKLEKLVHKNADRVKFGMGKRDKKMVDRIVNQVLIEDMILKKDVKNNIAYEMKSEKIKLNKMFKKVTYATLSLKNHLKLENLYHHKPQDELSKIKRIVKKSDINSHNEENDKYDTIKAHIFKTANPMNRIFLRFKS